MIPDFDEAGNLPPGIHDATCNEIAARFAYNPTRLAIFSNLPAWARLMAEAGCTTIYVNGSFVTAKPMPGDFDACWDIRGVDRSRIPACMLCRK